MRPWICCSRSRATIRTRSRSPRASVSPTTCAGECGEALPRLEHALTLRTADPSLLNALGDCHEELGDGVRARELFERSLELNPTQEGVRARLAELGDSR